MKLRMSSPMWIPIYSSRAKRGSAAGAHFPVLPAVLLALSLLHGCKRNEHQSPLPPDVTVARPLQRDVTEYLEASGQLAATNSVSLVARIPGYLEAIGYHDGAWVHKGSLLFTIEPVTYKAQLEQAKATLASAAANAEFSELNYHRYSELARTDSTSRQQAEQTRASRDTARASVLQAQASLTQAQITYGYTHVSAPFDGVVTAHQVNVGELVGGNQATQLATIVQLDPIWVNFNISEQDALRVRGSGAGAASMDLNNVAIDISLQDESDFPLRGHIDYIAPQIDPNTGTLAVRGLLDNPSHLLLPGYFVRIRIPVHSLKGALLVPGEAVANAQSGRTLLVVAPGDIVQVRAVTLGTREGSLQVITSGLKPDDRVIVEGLQGARSGQKVLPHEVQPTAALNIGTDTP